MPAFWVNLGDNDLNCVDVPLNPTHSLTHSLKKGAATEKYLQKKWNDCSL